MQQVLNFTVWYSDIIKETHLPNNSARTADLLSPGRLPENGHCKTRVHFVTHGIIEYKAVCVVCAQSTERTLFRRTQDLHVARTKLRAYIGVVIVKAFYWLSQTLDRCEYLTCSTCCFLKKHNFSFVSAKVL